MSLKQKLETSDGHQKYAEMQAKVKEADARSLDLARQLRHMERIQVGQGKALEKITNENDHPTQIKTLKDQLKVARDKNRELDERVRREEKNTIVLQERMVSLEEKNRELVAALKEKNAKRISQHAGWGGTGEDDGSNDMGLMPATFEL